MIRESRNVAAAKLTPGQVMEIRERYAAGATQGALAREYQLSIGQIGRIVRGESWVKLPQRLPTEEEIRLSAQRLMELQERVQAGLEGPEPTEQPPAIRPELPLSEKAATALRGYGVRGFTDSPPTAVPRSIPLDPLSGGEGAVEGTPALDKLAQETTADGLLEQLKEGK